MTQKTPFLHKAFIAALFLLLPIGIAWKGLFFVFLFCCLMLVWGLSYRLEWGWYVLVFLSLIPHWVLRFDDYWWFFTEYPQLLAVNAPYVDFWAVGLFAAFLVERFRHYLHTGSFHIQLPIGKWYGVFLLSAFISLFSLPSFRMLGGAWFIFRFLLLFYIGYVVLGTHVLQNKERIHRSLKILAWMGLGAAAMGAVSLVLHTWQGGVLPRAVPLSLFGWTPFGDQHVFIAEAMTTTLPIWLYAWFTEPNAKDRTWWGLGAGFILIICLLTFSRAGWVTLTVSSIVLALLLKKYVRWRVLFKKYRWAIGVFLLLAALFVTFMITTRDVHTSTATRWLLTEMAVYLFLLHPIIGNGAGSYTENVREIFLYNQEIGGFQDAHGVIQKLISEQGLFGLIAFGLMVLAILYPLYQAYKEKHIAHEYRWLALLGILLVIAPLTFQLFNTHFYSSKVWVPMSIALAIGALCKKELSP